jgi:transcriptional regulator with XRE-family HTH domain
MNTKEMLLALAERRKKLGMPLRALSRLTGTTRPTLCRVLGGDLKAARHDRVMKILQATGIRLRTDNEGECHLEPIPAEEFVERQARKQARYIVYLTQGTMALESQAVSQAFLDEMIGDTTRKLLAGPKRDLWEVS